MTITWALESFDIDDLTDYAKNPRQLTQEQHRHLKLSMERFGLIDKPVVNANGANTVIGGHQRLKVLREQGARRVDCWTPSRELSEREIEELNIRLNRNTGEWDFDILANEWEVGDLLDWGFTEHDFEMQGWNLGGEDVPADPGPQIDRAEELQEKWQVERGQVWQIGRHWLMCEDCRDVLPDFYHDCSTLFYDPEWDSPVDISGDFLYVLAFGDGATIGHTFTMFGTPTWVFVWDCVSSWYTPNRPLRRMKMCAWFGELAVYDFDGWHYGEAGKQRQVWNTRGEYLYIPDSRGKHLADVYVEPITQFHRDSLHPHSKPSDWVALLLGNCTRGDVYDPCAGEGTSFVASEWLGRSVRGVEIEPKYCAVTLERLAGMGLEPRLIDDG